MKSFYVGIWRKASQLFKSSPSSMDDDREPEIDPALNQHLQQTMNEELNKYGKKLDDSLENLLSRMKPADDLFSSHGDCKSIEFSTARRKEFVEKVKNIREIIQNEFRGDLAKLIASKYSNNANCFQKEQSGDSIDEITHLFKQLKLSSDSMEIDRETYSDVIDLFENLNISGKESNADIIDLLKRLSLSNIESLDRDDFSDSKTDECGTVGDFDAMDYNSGGDEMINGERKIDVEIHDLLVEEKYSSNNDSGFYEGVSLTDVDSLIKEKLPFLPGTHSDSVSEKSLDVVQSDLLVEEKSPSSPDIDSIAEESVVLVEPNLSVEKISSSPDTDSVILGRTLLDESDNILVGSEFSSSDADSVSGESSILDWPDFLVNSRRFFPEDEGFIKFSCNCCSETLATDRKNAAIAFTNFMVDKRLITNESRLSERELDSIYAIYEIETNPEVSISDQVLTILQTIGIVKKKPSPIDENNKNVEFEETFFLDRSHGLQVRSDESETRSKVLRALNPDYVNRAAMFRCSVCKNCFLTKEELDDHNISEIHILKTLHDRNRSWFLKDVDYLKISGIPNRKLSLDETGNAEISLVNVAKDGEKITIWRIFELVHFGGSVKMEYGSNYCLEKGESFKIRMKAKFTSILFNETAYPIVLKVSLNDASKCNYILIEPRFKAVKSSKRINCALTNLKNCKPHSKTSPENDERCITAESVKPSRNMITDAFRAFHSNRRNVAMDNLRVKRDIPKLDAQKNETKSASISEHEGVLHAPRIARASKVPKLALPENYIPKFLQTLLKVDFNTANISLSSTEEESLRNIKKLIFEDGTLKLRSRQSLTEHNYIERLHYEMWIEEYQSLKEMRPYARTDVSFLTDKLSENLIGIILTNLFEGRPSLLKGDFAIVKSKSTSFLQGFKRFEGSVQLVEKNAVYVRVNHETFYSEECWVHKADVEFRFNRTPLRMGHSVLESLPGFRWQRSLFPKSFDEKPKNIQLRPFFNQSIAENDLQVRAITNIVQNRAYPAPYILFGPPGTGKTATLVEAIAQVWSTIEKSRICVFASSNSAVDVIAKRLLQYIPLSDLIRIYSLSRNDADFVSELQGCCNYDSRTKEVFFPCFNELKRKRIVVMTPVAAGRYILCGVCNFDYIFIDEAAHALEVDVLIPIRAFLHNTSSSLVLAGDTKQLGPVVRSRYASDLGYGMSLMERLMTTCNLYKKDPVSGQYNSKVITKLLINYRSHEAILRIPNQQFYENELIAKGSEKLISSMSQWDKLPKKGFPIIFHSVKGLEKREDNSPSYFNLEEVDVVEDYVSKLFDSKNLKFDESDVGVISPYRKQVQKIRQRLFRSWTKINIASVEEFQGQERKIIIMSTVRSRHELLATDYKYGLGFLKNEKRFNVAITRAISLLIVIGNPDILQCDPNWRAFLKFCKDNSAFIGEPASGSLPDLIPI
ncbi:uncharacterized protein LOC135836764 isoform X2 [Planococcus citri]|uniref:uncharacterized protein LOC135836764 isoform X2 n=1 Tax=Planococcus citri TaxID=170843 RepID=UPI0031F85C89